MAGLEKLCKMIIFSSPHWPRCYQESLGLTLTLEPKWKIRPPGHFVTEIVESNPASAVLFYLSVF